MFIPFERKPPCPGYCPQRPCSGSLCTWNMPIDSTRTTPARRTQRKITEEEMKEIEMKRIRGELSCAECRRLKLRCDKKVPCGSCCRRGCESICPCGILSAGQGTRFILADTEQLHDKITGMSNRIRHLEDALAIMQSGVSEERHPLLSDELLKIKFGAEALPRTRRMQDEEDDNERMQQSIDAVGSLTLNESGEGPYFGRSAGSETLMAGEESSSSEDEGGSPEALPPEIETLSGLFPFMSKHLSKSHSLELLNHHLPSYDRAWYLANSYLDHASYFFRPIKREELIDTLPNVYNTANQRIKMQSEDSPRSNDSSCVEPELNDCHALAMGFFLFALGALFDVNLPPYNAEAKKYYDLGRAALSAKTVYHSPSIDTVQAVGLMATYHTLAGKKYSRDSAWCLIGLAEKLAQSIGLHRDSARWSFASAIVDKRRNVFWEIMALDISNSLALGRPPSTHYSFVDCEFPIDEEATLNNEGQIEYGFWRMKHTFAREVFIPIVGTTLAAKSSSYAAILNLDREVREAVIPSSLASAPNADMSSSMSLRSVYATMHRIVPLLYLHRSYFAQALLDHPTNPLLSPFSPSFLTAYRAATITITLTKNHFESSPETAMRIWFFLYHTFSSAIIVGTVVTRSPTSSFAPRAFHELQVAIDLFEQGAKHSSRARTALNLLSKLNDKAKRASGHYSTGIAQVLGSPTYACPCDEVNEELAIFGGQKCVIRCKSKPHKTASSPPGDDSLLTYDIKSDYSVENNRSHQDIHPMLLQYLQGATFHSSPGQNTMIPILHPQVSLRLPKTSGRTTKHYSMLAVTVGGNASQVTTETYASTTSAFGTMGSKPNRSNSFSGPLQQGYSSEGALEWNGKMEAISVQLSDTRYTDWLASPPLSRLDNAQDMELSSCPPSGSGLTDVTHCPQIQRLTGASESCPARTPPSSTLPSSSNLYSIPRVGGGQGPGPFEFDIPSRDMIELGMSSEVGTMDTRWVTFVRDCGLVNSGNNG